MPNKRKIAVSIGAKVAQRPDLFSSSSVMSKKHLQFVELVNLHCSVAAVNISVVN